MQIGGVDFESLEYESIGSWPVWLRFVIVIGIGLLVIIAGYWLYISDSIDQLEAIKFERQQLQDSFARTHHQAINLDAYRQQVGDVRQRINQLTQVLPKSSEEATLLDDISQQATLSGLKFRSIKPQSEQNKGFYNEEPIDLELTGTFHGLGEFVSSLSSLPRIVTLHNFVIGSNKLSPDKLDITLSIKTYWIGENETVVSGNPVTTPAPALKGAQP